MDSPRLLNVEKAAAYLDLSPVTIRRYYYAGRLPGTRIGPKLLRFAVTDLDALVNKGPATRSVNLDNVVEVEGVEK